VGVLTRFLGTATLRQWSTVGLGLPLLVLGLVALVQAGLLRGELLDTERVRAEGELRQLADGLESLVADQVTGWLVDLTDDARALPVHEKAHRLRTPWFDAVYVWTQGPDGPRVTYPLDVAEEMTTVLETNPCVQLARILSQEQVERDLARLYETCEHEVPEVQLLAAWRAGTTLLLQDRADDALRALDRLQPVERYRLAGALELGLSPRRVVRCRLLRIDALARMGRTQDAAAEATELALELVDQPGPVQQDFGALIPDELLPRLERLGEDDAARTTARQAPRLRRRADGWQEVRLKAARREAPNASEGPRMAHDLYDSPPYLLAIAQVGPNRGAAIQLDQPALLAELLRRSGESRGHLVVRDARDEVVLGPRTGSIAIEVPFGGVLGHLRVGLTQSLLEDRVDAVQWRFAWQLATVLAAVATGLMALWARLLADRRERELLLRQREFTARVTHELKTPLAGIRVMAENLELGFGDAETRATFAKRIVSEADRLTARIDEVLRLSREPRQLVSGPINLRDLLEQLVHTWRPRMEEAGITLYGSLQPVPTFHGDQPMIQDLLNGLLDNALKYHREDHPDPRVWVRLRRVGRQAIIDVEDNGLGVPPGKRKIIFERFSRVEGPGRGRSGGHGLGLAFAGETVRSHGGRIECVAGSEGGARFVIRLPLESRRS